MLWFWVIVLVALIGAIAVVAAGRGDSMAEVYGDRPDATLPAGRALTSDDLASLRLNTGVRGYRMDEVDALLARLEAEMIEREDSDVRPVTPQPMPDEDALAEPLLDEPQLAEPLLAEPQLDEPQLAEPQLDEPQLAEPQLDEEETAEDSPDEGEAPPGQEPRRDDP